MKRSSVLDKHATVLSSGRKGKPPSTSGRSRSWRALFGTAALALFAAWGYGQTTAPQGPVDKSHGFPWYYQDPRSMQLEPCLDSNGACVLLADPGFDPNRVVSFPGNFPSEFFYSVVDSDKIPTAGCKGAKPGLIKYRAAVEGAFANGGVRPGDQITFGRMKIVASGLCPSTEYTFTHPYGKETITTDGNGAVGASQKIDIGCGGAPCDFSLANQSPVLSGFLTSDGPKPAGFLGDSATLATVTGSPNNTNFFRVEGPGPSGTSLSLSTSLFTVAGRIAGPVMVTPSALDLGVVNQGQSLSKSLTVTNITGGSVPIGVSITSSPNSGDFSANGCPGTLDAGASCTLTVTFKPQTTSPERAQLQLGSQRIVDLGGTGIPANATAGVSLSTTSLSFGPVRVRGTSVPQTVTVTNSGSGTLDITAGFDTADQFGIASDTCTGRPVAAGATCTINVTFSPTTLGDKTANLILTDNAANSPQTVSLSGTGNGGVSAVSTTMDQYGFADWYQDENAVKLQPCLSAADPTCVVLPEPGFNPALPLHFDSSNTGINFPSEAFYFVADASLTWIPSELPSAVASCSDGSSLTGTTAKATYRAAIEAAFANTDPKWGDQITFTRSKIVVTTNGLCPNTDYYFTHPYGKDLFTTDGQGKVAPNTKIDTGCFNTPCDFSLALGGRVLGSYLKWDPAVAPLAPAGHLGDGNLGTLHTIVGSPFTDPVSRTPANFFQISDTHGNVIASTNLFTVAGLLYPTVTAPPAPPPTGNEAITITLAQFRNDQKRWTVTGTDTLIANQALSITWNHLVNGVPSATPLGTATVTTTGAWNFDIRGVATNLIPKAGDSVTVTAPSKATKSATVSVIK